MWSTMMIACPVEAISAEVFFISLIWINRALALHLASWEHAMTHCVDLGCMLCFISFEFSGLVRLGDNVIRFWETCHSTHIKQVNRWCNNLRRLDLFRSETLQQFLCKSSGSDNEIYGDERWRIVMWTIFSDRRGIRCWWKSCILIPTRTGRMITHHGGPTG